MRVVTIDGGFRGLGNLPAATRNELVNDLTARIATFDDTWERFAAFRASGNVSAVDDATLTAQYEEITNALNALMVRAPQLANEAMLAQWRVESQQVLRAALDWTRRTRTVMGEELASRGMKIALIAAASITLLGGGMYVLYRRSKRRGRR